ncbi:expressed unknown protein [Seminavis robusta]|uniref:Fe2OG dioxygenase domain-containing protein n=1 Tax=Seminavis robusta TaxID=568900 RepID=A0A9N8HMN8_9STRA|nr:expressed unknown protein [Seminavis robusta]|eukprot:Sro1135_g245040.1 n/a (503) ;mRNA; f:14674-16281
MPFPTENNYTSTNNTTTSTKQTTQQPQPQHEWVTSDSTTTTTTTTTTATTNNNNTHVALRTTGQPLLSKSDISIILNAAKAFRNNNRKTTTSTRFTMQYAGNSDLHVADLVSMQPSLQPILEKLLHNQIYPLVRSAFLLPHDDDANNDPQPPLCVYDALIVRYDGQAAANSGRDKGASLPLHRDGGLFTVNIALQGDGNGGTLFDNLITSSTKHTASHHDDDIIERAIVHPLSPGHAVAHRSTERHAGAPTKPGEAIREILVFFITLRETLPTTPITLQHQQQSNNPGTIHIMGNPTQYATLAGIERAFYLKEIAAQQSKSPAAADNTGTSQTCYQWALAQNPSDGEALFWVGYFQVQRARAAHDRMVGKEDDNQHMATVTKHVLRIWRDFDHGIQALETVANRLDPCNIRSLAFLGSAYSWRWCFAQECHPQQFGLRQDVELGKAAAVLQRAVRLEELLQGIIVQSEEQLFRATLLDQLAEILLIQGKVGQAADCVEKARS